MSRGNYWEQTYQPSAIPQDAKIELARVFTEGKGQNWKFITSQGGAVYNIRRKANAPVIKIEQCDISCEVADSHISNVKFVGCRFEKTVWRNVRFSKCSFQRCHWGNVVFDDCNFINTCSFEEMSASAETLVLRSTAIPPSEFLSSLEPNVRDLPGDVSIAYQRYRFLATKANLAKMVWTSNVDEANLDYYLEAQGELMKADLDRRVGESAYNNDKKCFRGRFSACMYSLMPRMERRLVYTAGCFSLWGRSLIRPIVIGLVSVVVFMVIWKVYACYLGVKSTWLSCLGRSLNLFLVAGYTIHIGSISTFIEKGIGIANVVVGLIWYALLVPVWLRRLIRS